MAHQASRAKHQGEPKSTEKELLTAIEMACDYGILDDNEQCANVPAITGREFNEKWGDTVTDTEIVERLRAAMTESKKIVSEASRRTQAEIKALDLGEANKS